MTTNDEESAPDADVSPVRDAGAADDLTAWLALGAEAGTVFQQFLALLRLEARLALGDAGRLLVVVVLMLPLALLAWLGLSALIAWLAFAGSESVALAILAFLGVQVLSMVLLAFAARRFRRSLSLPATRRQWDALFDKKHPRTDDREPDT